MTVSDDLKGGKRDTWWRLLLPAGACVVAFAVLYARVLAHLAHRWSSDGNYSHGFLVPLIAAAFIYTRRKDLGKLQARSSCVLPPASIEK